eukprot:2397796-Lingulodinium_polyedra.AAC.1
MARCSHSPVAIAIHVVVGFGWSFRDASIFVDHEGAVYVLPRVGRPGPVPRQGQGQAGELGVAG